MTDAADDFELRVRPVIGRQEEHYTLPLLVPYRAGIADGRPSGYSKPGSISHDAQPTPCQAAILALTEKNVYLAVVAIAAYTTLCECKYEVWLLCTWNRQQSRYAARMVFLAAREDRMSDHVTAAMRLCCHEESMKCPTTGSSP